jgi:hypothetical protein
MNIFLKMQRFRSRLFLLFLVLLTVGFFGKDNFKNVPISDMSSPVFSDPVQTPAADKAPIKFEKDGFSFTLTPLYNYQISGLVVHRMDYNKWYSLSRTDKTFTTDVCMLWGDNIKSGAYQNKSLDIKQDFRFCLFSYWGELSLRNDQFSNNHLIIRDSKIMRINEEISPGDQVRITGKLVNVRAKVNGKTKQYEPEQADWMTSTIRTDTSGGACEIIYVENIEIVRKGNTLYHTMYSIGKYGLWLVIFWYLCDFMKSVFFFRRNS